MQPGKIIKVLFFFVYFAAWHSHVNGQGLDLSIPDIKNYTTINIAFDQAEIKNNSGADYIFITEASPCSDAKDFIGKEEYSNKQMILDFFCSDHSSKKSGHLWALQKSPFKILDAHGLVKQDINLLILLEVSAAAVITQLPSSVTKWEDNDYDFNNIVTKWEKNVTSWPVMDKDDWWINWIGHPVSGAYYYVRARVTGGNRTDAFLYSIAISTLWEYGIESFAEKPSIQDLVITPVLGSLLGELFYQKKEDLLKKEKTLGSKPSRRIALFLLDPLSVALDGMAKKAKKLGVDEISGAFTIDSSYDALSGKSDNKLIYNITFRF
jgi:hypothetical protein